MKKLFIFVFFCSPSPNFFKPSLHAQEVKKPESKDQSLRKKSQSTSANKKNEATKKATESKKEKSQTKRISTQDLPSKLSIQKSNEIIEEIRNQNPGSDRYIGLRMGTIQILSNITGLETSADKTLLSTGADINFRVWRNWYFEAIYTEHLNSINPSEFSGSPSRTLSDIYYKTLDIGIKYRFVLDETKPANFLGFRILKHKTENNFELADPSSSIIINEYEGMTFGVEKGIPITDRLGINASLDMISITGIAQESDFTVEEKGLGFVVRGELYYNLHFFGRKWRTSLAYWQSGMINEFSSADRDLFERQNLVLTYRMISGAFAMTF